LLTGTAGTGVDAGTVVPETSADETVVAGIPADRVVPAARKPRTDGRQSVYDEVTTGDTPLTLGDLETATPEGADGKFTGTQLLKLWNQKKAGVKRVYDIAAAAEIAGKLRLSTDAADAGDVKYDDAKTYSPTFLKSPIYTRFLGAVRKSRQAVNTGARTDVAKALEADASIVDSNELSAAELDEVMYEGVDEGIDKQMAAAEKAI
jgi:hypothetical protein